MHANTRARNNINLATVWEVALEVKIGALALGRSARQSADANSPAFSFFALLLSSNPPPPPRVIGASALNLLQRETRPLKGARHRDNARRSAYKSGSHSLLSFSLLHSPHTHPSGPMRSAGLLWCPARAHARAKSRTRARDMFARLMLSGGERGDERAELPFCFLPFFFVV